MMIWVFLVVLVLFLTTILAYLVAGWRRHNRMLSVWESYCQALDSEISIAAKQIVDEAARKLEDRG